MHFLPDDGTKLDYLRAITARLHSGSPFVLADLQGDKQSELFKRLVEGWQKRAQIAGMESQRLTELVNGMWQHLQCIPEERTLELLDQASFRGRAVLYSTRNRLYAEPIKIISQYREKTVKLLWDSVSYQTV